MPYLKKTKSNSAISFNKIERHKIYNTSKWRKLRQIYLMYNPLCEICLSKNIIKQGEHIHHLDSFLNYEGNEREYKAYDYNNLITLCEECHSKIHANEGTTRDTSKEQLINRINKL